MKILILGTKLILTSTLCRLTATAIPGKWSVVVSGSPTRTKYWTTNKFIILNSGEPAENIILDNIDPESFEKDQHLKTLVENCPGVIVATNSPLAMFSKETLKTFDKILISKTSKSEKQVQYHTLFIDNCYLKLADFKKQVSGLKDDEYLTVDPLSNVLIQPTTVDEQCSSADPSLSLAVFNNDEQSEINRLSQLFDERVQFDDLHTNTLIISIQEVDPFQFEDSVAEFLSQPVIRQMFKNVHVDRSIKQTRTLTFVVPVEKDALFNLCLLTYFRDLRRNGKIKHACILVG